MFTLEGAVTAVGKLAASWPAAVALVAGALAGGVVAELIVRLVRRAAAAGGGATEHSLLARLAAPARLLLVVIGAAIGTDVRPFPQHTAVVVGHALLILGVATAAWLAFRATYVLEDVVVARLPSEGPDLLTARRSKTQVQVFRRVVAVGIVVVSVAVILLSFSAVRVAGASLLASAGILGIVLGVAAKPVTSNFLAGIQIAVSQPLRVDDIVVVDGHWGRIEEIDLTYVVVRIWDERCLVLPISYLIENPFENWSRTGTGLLEVVHLEVDHTTRVDELRAYLHQLLVDSPEFDGRTWSLQVTGAGPSSMQVRAVMSARDSSSGWLLQCNVREKLIAYLRDHDPGGLPRVRTGEPIGQGERAGVPGVP